MTKQEKLKKIAKRMKISEAELKRIQKASPFDEKVSGLSSRGRNKYGLKIQNKNWDEGRISKKEGIKSFGEHSIEYDPNERKGSYANPLKKKPKKK
tara:strand:+ start:51 stop:338 length:288 start_codon:yes stop_codon:yes gene_type:complete